MKMSERIGKVRDLISNEENWCKNFFAKNIEGKKVAIQSGEAYSFCMRGAIYRVEGISDSIVWNTIYQDVLNLDTPEKYLTKKLNNYVNKLYSIACFNNKVSHEEVLKFLDWSISEAKKEEIIDEMRPKSEVKLLEYKPEFLREREST